MKIDTPKGLYKYKFIPIYVGIKKIDKIIAKENLLLFKRIADENSLRFGLCYGTMLGAIREHDFIEHDEDIDLFILSEQRDVFLSMLFELRKYSFEVARYDRRGGLISIIRKGEYIDIYIFSPMKDDLREALGDPMPEKYLKNLSLYEFQGESFLGASDSIEMMQFFYGENWSTPIVYADFDLPFYKKMIQYIMWYTIYYMPDCLFYKVMEARKQKKIDRYEMRLERLKRIIGQKNILLL
ncbi:MAG: LicD family protein [Prevotella sp.]|jgi:hypothetical protein|nr:LicD family protein [Prevotella sp.]